MSISIFYTSVELLGKFEHSSLPFPRLDFLEVGFKRVIGIDYIIICANIEVTRAEFTADLAKDLNPIGYSQIEDAI